MSKLLKSKFLRFLSLSERETVRQMPGIDERMTTNPEGEAGAVFESLADLEAARSQAAAAREADVRSRRQMFTGLGALSALIMQACDSSVFTGNNDKNNSRQTATEDDNTVDDPDDGGEDGGDDDEPDVLPPAGGCHATKTNVIKGNYPKTPADLQPKVVFYGRKDGSTLMAYQFDTEKEIESVHVKDQNDVMISYQRLTEADRKWFEGDGKGYMPMTVDNMHLRAVKKVKMMVKSDGKIYQHEIAISYFMTFDNGTDGEKPVSDYANPDEIAKFLDGAGTSNTGQSVATFAISNAGGFYPHSNLQFPDASGNAGGRPLFMATQDSKWQDQGGLKGVITDIMGNILDKTDGQIIIKHQTLVTYNYSATHDVYLRTMLKIG